jgi:hypothetical protein
MGLGCSQLEGLQATKNTPSEVFVTIINIKNFENTKINNFAGFLLKFDSKNLQI